MGRSILSQFLIISNTSPRCIASMPFGVRLRKCLGKTGVMNQQRRHRIGENFRCICSVSVPEPSTSDASTSSVK
ncbi:hypothetical protein ACJIZ3_001604 [Penstemon smallii]|uniref:Secreted protein n=1 Tax=Penstemon smallii TaxID=265156 RepID=A0ABD3U5V3_9LAMI